MHIAGRVLPVRHYGSVDIFLEAMGTAQRGDILVIDNQGRMDEGCIGISQLSKRRLAAWQGLSFGEFTATQWNFIR
jgi:regulator of RNase E activity RraA